MRVSSRTCSAPGTRSHGCGKVRLRATGSSMLPEVRPGDVLVIHRRELSEIRLGDIAVFSCYGGVAAHRIILKEAGSCTSQGDSVPCPDPPVTAENYLGLVVSLERAGTSLIPCPRPGVLSRFTAAVLRRSDLATRLWLAGWRLISSLRKSSEPVFPADPSNFAVLP